LKTKPSAGSVLHKTKKKALQPFSRRGPLRSPENNIFFYFYKGDFYHGN